MDFSEDTESKKPRFQQFRDFISRHRVRLGILVAFMLFLGVTGIIFLRPRLVEEANRPLGPSLPSFPTPTANPTIEQNASNSSSELILGLSEPVCDGPRQMIILAVGSDSRTSDIGGLADVIRIVRVDFVDPKLSVLSIPRDLWVSIPGISPYGAQLRDYFGLPVDSNGQEIPASGDYARINVAYFYGNLYGLPGGGPTVLAETIFLNTGLPVEHYVGIDMNLMVRLVDAIGGIEIDIPYDIEGFKAGQQHFDGEQALTYSRIRNPDNDWYRANRQNQVLLALLQKVRQPQTFPKLPSVVDDILEDAQTDLSRSQITNLICLLGMIDREEIHSYAIGPDMVTSTYTSRGSFILLPHDEEIRQFVGEFYAGVLPE